MVERFFFFSIVMPVYNVEIKWLDKAIESIEKQKLQKTGRFALQMTVLQSRR